MSQLRVNDIVSENGQNSPNFSKGLALSFAVVNGITTFQADIQCGGDIIGDNATDITGINSVTASGFYGPLTGDVTGNAVNLSGTPDLNVGVVTSTEFNGPLVGNLTGNVLGNVTGDATGLSGSPNIAVTNLVGAAATFTGNVEVQGTLTYEDVTQIDAVGIITANAGIDITGGGMTVVGVSTFEGGISVNSLLKEEAQITNGKLSDNQDMDLENGMVHYFTTTETTTSTLNVRYSNTVTLNSQMAIGEMISISVFTSGAAAGYMDSVFIDGTATGVTTVWAGGSPPSSGGNSNIDLYSFSIIKTADATFLVVGAQTKTS